jgi:hypothetical protein
MAQLKLKKLQRIVVLFVFSAIIAYLAKLQIYSLNFEFLWSLYLPVQTAGCVFAFDYLVELIDFEEIKKLEGSSKYIYKTALCLLGGLFAVALAIFLK